MAPRLASSLASRCLATTASAGQVVGRRHPRVLTAMEPSFQPAALEESKVYEFWDEHLRIFAAPPSTPARRCFSLVLPPPNVTGQLHIGHALTVTVEDALVRWRRMCGDAVLYVPGTDHAGIATQAVVERILWRDEELTRHDLGREAFLGKVWEWKNSKGAAILNQIRRLGASVDHARTVFTLDADRSRAVTEAFVELHRRGLIFRGVRMVNWSPALRTVISDIEVEHEEISGRTMRRNLPGHAPEREYEFGVLVEFAYEVIGPQGDVEGEVVVATTRLETMLGDVGVAVHPEDERYAHLRDGSRTLRHPFSGRALAIVLDAELVDPEYGTGAVKLSPAHDPNDLACAARHGLPHVVVFDDDGTINAEVGGQAFGGMARFDARVAIEGALAQRGLLRGKRDNAMQLPLCSRSGDVVEPALKPQWFVDCAGMARRAARMAQDGRLNISPRIPHLATWMRWLSPENVRDWCVSRQLWWGHRIPAFRVVLRGGAREDDDEGEERWVVARDAKEAEAEMVSKYGVDSLRKYDLVQDEDVLDTWFSSALFPLSALGWPRSKDPSQGGDDCDLVADLTPEFAGYYPLSVMETGSDILFFWVARMVMLCSELHPVRCDSSSSAARTSTAQDDDVLPPFREVFLHPVVRDKGGRKMSKSLGNVIDPLDVIDGVALDAMVDQLRSSNLPAAEQELAAANLAEEYPNGIEGVGTDALRHALASYLKQGRQINLDTARLATSRHFCNKLWNATRFCLSQLETSAAPLDPLLVPPIGLAERWILGRLIVACEACGSALASYELAEVCEAAGQRFFMSELCDVYIEAAKPALRGHAGAAAAEESRVVLSLCLDAALRLLHPLMPFVTEELWQRLRYAGYSGLIGESRGAATISLAPYPCAATLLTEPMCPGAVQRDLETEAAMDELLDIARAVRALVAMGRGTVPVDDVAVVLPQSHQRRGLLTAQGGLIATLARTPGLEVTCAEDGQRERRSLLRRLDSGAAVLIYMPEDEGEGLQSRIHDRLADLRKRVAKRERERQRLQARLGSAAFVDQAPPAVVEKTEVQLRAVESALADDLQALGAFESLV